MCIRFWRPWHAAFAVACCGVALCVVASRSIVLGQDVPTQAAEATPAEVAAEPADVDQGNESPTDSEAVAAEEPDSIDDDPQNAVPLDDGQVVADDAPPAQLEPASLDGVRPGTTREQLHEAWGKPLRTMRIAGGARETYHLDKLGQVRATITEDVVESLLVHVEHPLALSVVASRLALDDVEPVEVYDEQGELLGAAYPPKGVLLGYVPRSDPPRVFQAIIEPIDPQAFLARAEVRLPTRYADCLADVRQALALIPQSGHAHRLQAEIALNSGDLEAALAGAQKAIELAPDELPNRLLLAEVLAASGDYPQAVTRLRDLLDQPDVPDVVAARAWSQWGDYLAHSAARDYAHAIQHHQQAIQLAKPLVHHDHHSVRRAAKEVLVDAHLAVAYDIGWGRWQRKSTVVPKWIDRATAFADSALAGERGGGELYLRVYTGALAALAGIAEPPEPQKWIKGITQHGKRMYDEAVDPAYRARLAWQIGGALSHAVEIQAARHQPDDAVRLGHTALALFEESSPVAGRLPTYNYERGRLCYLMGAVHSVERDDHAGAVEWFDRAAPLLEKPVPAAAVNTGTQGETFVSMAISYWHQDDRGEAIRLTSQGLKLMERAVRDGALAKAALAVPYNNLASMHEALGQYDEARRCAELATRYEEKAATK